jgi:hypothetical protein
MSVVVTAVAPFTADMYDAVTERVMPEGQLPEGCQLHIAGPVEQGWRVITVWDTAEAFNSFREEKLLPAIGEVSGGEAPDQVKPEIDPIHRLITA